MKKLSKVILLIETSRAFGRGLLNGIARYSRLHGPWSFYREPRGLISNIPRLESWKADGIIMRNCGISHEILKMNLPTILALHDKSQFPDLPVVITNGKRIAQLGSEHLLDRGLKNFAFCGYDNLFWSEERQNYFIQFIADAGYKTYVYEQPKSKKNKSWEKEQLRMSEWLSTLPKPVGIMACNDDRGQHVLEACKIAELHVPEEVAVIGVDNDALICDLCDPPLTSVALNTEAAGYSSAELLDRLIRGEKMQSQEIIVPTTHVVKRQSTDVLAMQDNDVTSAIRFIRLNTKKKLRVNDIVSQTCLSRRSLESRFRKIFNRSIQEEIRRTRTEQIAQILIETNLSISEITSAFNFTDVEHIARYFRKEKGMGLREFRKLHRR